MCRQERLLAAAALDAVEEPCRQDADRSAEQSCAEQVAAAALRLQAGLDAEQPASSAGKRQQLPKAQQARTERPRQPEQEAPYAPAAQRAAQEEQEQPLAFPQRGLPRSGEPEARVLPEQRRLLEERAVALVSAAPEARLRVLRLRQAAWEAQEQAVQAALAALQQLPSSE